MITAILAGILVGAVGTSIYEGASEDRRYWRSAALALLGLAALTVELVYGVLNADMLSAFMWSVIAASFATWVCWLRIRYRHHH